MDANSRQPKNSDEDSDSDDDDDGDDDDGEEGSGKTGLLWKLQSEQVTALLPATISSRFTGNRLPHSALGVWGCCASACRSRGALRVNDMYGLKTRHTVPSGSCSLSHATFSEAAWPARLRLIVIASTEPDMPEKGLFGMAFMRRAMERQKKEAQQMLEELKARAKQFRAGKARDTCRA
eukprot:5133031-Pleurochrysis_carterae.AAC.1